MLKKFNILLFIVFTLLNSPANSNAIENIVVNGNDRISSETIIMFSGAKNLNDIENDDINKILKNLYETNFFENVSVTLNNKTLLIDVLEFPIIEKVEFDGIKAKKIKKQLRDTIKIKSRSSYNSVLVSNDVSIIKFQLKRVKN